MKKFEITPAQGRKTYERPQAEVWQVEANLHLLVDSPATLGVESQEEWPADPTNQQPLLPW